MHFNRRQQRLIADLSQRRIPILWLCTISVLCGSLFAQTATHDREFWQQIAKNKYEVPPNESADALARELAGLVGSPDPELRDDLGYAILVRWIYRKNLLSTATLLSLTDEFRGNLADGIGENGTNSVLKRSFSALHLSEMATRDAKIPFMGAERYHKLVAEAISYLKAEQDLRGYDAKLHWIHATAHTADLLNALADNAMLTHEEAAVILTAIADRLKTAPSVYSQGEQNRLAAAIVSVVHRPDFDAAGFDAWLARIEDEDRDVWTSTTVESLARYQNHNYTLQALSVRLALEQDSPRMADFRHKVLDVLRKRE